LIIIIIIIMLPAAGHAPAGEVSRIGRIAGSEAGLHRRKERARAFLCINNMQQVCRTPDCPQAKRCISLTAAPSKVHYSP
jgi:hypothetical protein